MLLLVTLTACGDGDSTVAAPTTTGPPPATASASPPPPTAVASGVPSSEFDQQLTVSYAAGKITGNTGRVAVKLGSKVRIVVTSDVPDELHLHVYDLKRALRPGVPAEIIFTADVPGQIELELEKARRQLVRLVIS